MASRVRLFRQNCVLIVPELKGNGKLRDDKHRAHQHVNGIVEQRWPSAFARVPTICNVQPMTINATVVVQGKRLYAWCW
jgi:hypothetical protein